MSIWGLELRVRGFGCSRTLRMLGPGLSTLVWLQRKHWTGSQESGAFALALRLSCGRDWGKAEAQSQMNWGWLEGSLSLLALTLESGRQCPLVSLGSAGASHRFFGTTRQPFPDQGLGTGWWKHPWSRKQSGHAPCSAHSPVFCRVTEVTVAWITLALVSFSRPEQTSLLPPSTDHRLPWAPASDMAPGRGESGQWVLRITGL